MIRKRILKSVIRKKPVDPAFEKFLKEIQELTKFNNHTESRLEVAKFYNLKKYIKIFELISKLQDVDGSMDYNLSRYRQDKTAEMLTFVKAKKGNSIVKKINSAL